MREQEINTLTEAISRSAEFRLHPLGFFYLQDKLTLAMSRRIHVWLKATNAKMENDVHQHSYNIDSLAIAGKIRNDLLHYKETAEGMAFEFQVVYEGERSILRNTGRRGNLVPMASFETAEGTRYQLEAGVIHRVTVEEVPCATVLTTIEQGFPIYSYGPADSPQPFTRRMAKSREARDIAMVLAKALR